MITFLMQSLFPNVKELGNLLVTWFGAAASDWLKLTVTNEGPGNIVY